MCPFTTDVYIVGRGNVLRSIIESFPNRNDNVIMKERIAIRKIMVSR
jgi:hypothetical protein